MKPRVKLLTVWFGPLPPWMHLFLERVRANRIIDWQLIQPTSVKYLNEVAEKALGVPCRKETAYAACNDLRPMYGEIFKDLIGDSEWWGWVDLDVVLGDLDRLLPPLLDQYHVITTAATYLHGPLTMLRNRRDINALGRDTGGWMDVLADRDYWNFDETGFNDMGDLGANGNPSFTKRVKVEQRFDDLSIRWDDRCWTDTFQAISDKPFRCWRVMADGRMFECPTKRELLCYHVASKQWKDATQWYTENPELLGQQRAKIKERSPPLIPSVEADWSEEGIAKYPTHLDAIKQMIRPGQSVIDCGCGRGDLLRHLPEGAEYRGVDHCLETVDAAREANKDRTSVGGFSPYRIESLPWLSGSFDWAVCRGLEGTVKTQQGCRAWAKMRDEMLRVAKRLLLMDYSGGWRVVERMYP